ncbi:hypothetical protein XELAEV_18017166mg [Xenopus laevis]|uniref:Uncharacterized protein n=1 Tax=Xenopus laevis TaxID=8355 RepID=A0A974DB42_XENLA|nr:hypothetical protein XELAEV_18017166mg [Xenopus laevis]
MILVQLSLILPIFQLKMFGDIAVHFLLIHCFGAFVFAQGARHFFHPNDIIEETIDTVDKIKKELDDMPNVLFKAPKKIQDDGCLTKNIIIFEQEVIKIKSDNRNLSKLTQHIGNNLKCLQTLCSRLNNTREDENCGMQKENTKAFLTDLEHYLKHISINDICSDTSKTFKACH